MTIDWLSVSLHALKLILTLLDEIMRRVPTDSPNPGVVTHDRLLRIKQDVRILEDELNKLELAQNVSSNRTTA